jgi:hypothetical protein
MAALFAPKTLTLLLKLAALALLAALAAQPILAGQHFSGQPHALQLHGAVGDTAAWLALGQAALAGFCWYRGALRLSAALTFVLIFALVGLQLHAGYVRTLSLHIPLGAALLALSLVTTMWLWRWPALRAPATPD